VQPRPQPERRSRLDACNLDVKRRIASDSPARRASFTAATRTASASAFRARRERGLDLRIRVGFHARNLGFEHVPRASSAARRASLTAAARAASASDCACNASSTRASVVGLDACNLDVEKAHRAPIHRPGALPSLPQPNRVGFRLRVRDRGLDLPIGVVAFTRAISDSSTCARVLFQRTARLPDGRRANRSACACACRPRPDLPIGVSLSRAQSRIRARASRPLQRHARLVECRRRERRRPRRARRATAARISASASALTRATSDSRTRNRVHSPARRASSTAAARTVSASL
jgi:hypothetical protein